MIDRGLSVVIPTLNCAEAMPAHIESMKPWLDLPDEITAVDSDSEDGTPDLIRKKVRHPNLRIINHPRGLYQSWNHAISQSTGKWIYISTIGDTITREQLEHLLAAGEALKADVVASPPRFVFDAHIDMKAPVWPVHRILEFYGICQPFVIDPLAAFVLAVNSNPDAILGSSASNIYRGRHLRARPFPTCFRMAGDTGWAIRHALETRFCYTARQGSVFRFHSETYTCLDKEADQRLIQSLHEEGVMAVRENSSHANRAIMDLLDEGMRLKMKHQQARMEWRLAKIAGRIPWYLRPSAIRSHNNYKSVSAELAENSKRMGKVLKTLPLQTVS